MDFHQKLTKTKGSHDQIQIQIHKYKYKYAHTNTNTHTQMQIQLRGALRSQILNFDPTKKSFHGNGHISGPVRPTSLRHPSKRSSLPARPERHIRGSLTCPGNTGEPEAPVSGGHRIIEIGSVWVRSQKMTKTQE